MRTEVLTSAAEVFALQPHWDELHRRTLAPVSMSPIWLSTWWDIFGRGFGMRTLAGWEGERLVGLFPCFLESFSLFGLRATRMRFLGEYSILAEYHPLVDPAYEEVFAVSAADFCVSSLKAGAADFIDVHAFPYDLPFMQRWISVMRERWVWMTVRDREVPRVRIDLPRTMAEYLGSLSSSERGSLRKKQRRILDAGASYTCMTDPKDTQAFQDYVRLNTKVWEGRGAGSYYTARAGFRQFQEQVTRAFLERGEARLYFLEQNGVRFAALHAFVVNGVMQAYLAGRDPDHPLSRWSPGLLMMIHGIGRAIEEGLREFDFLTGNQEYKYHLKGTVHGYHGRVTASLRSPRGWKGALIIALHNAAVAAGKSRRLKWFVRQFDRLSGFLRGHTPTASSAEE